MKQLTSRFAKRIACTVVVAGLAACAVDHSENFVSLVMTKELAMPAAPIRGLSVSLTDGRFSDVTRDGKFLPLFSSEAQRNVRTLFTALRDQLPRVFARNGIDVTLRPGTPGSTDRADYSLDLRPLQAGELPGKPIELTFGIDVHDRDGKLVWRGTALERVNEKSARQAEMAKWSDAMAEDLARTLLTRWSHEGIVKIGHSGAAPL